MEGRLGFPVGYSDHYSRHRDSTRRRNAGAVVIEKNFHPSTRSCRTGPFCPRWNLRIKIGSLSKEFEMSKRRWGPGRKEPSPSEARHRAAARRKPRVAGATSAGSVVTSDYGGQPAARDGPFAFMLAGASFGRSVLARNPGRHPVITLDMLS